MIVRVLPNQIEELLIDWADFRIELDRQSRVVELEFPVSLE